jgi:hypothetical protein
MWTVEIERHLFSGETNHHTVTCRTYKAGHHCAYQVPSLLTLTFQSFILSFTAHCTAPISHAMLGETDQALHVASEAIIDKNKTAFGAENDAK